VNIATDRPPLQPGFAEGPRAECARDGGNGGERIVPDCAFQDGRKDGGFPDNSRFIAPSIW
jgi:hypothetical protein